MCSPVVFTLEPLPCVPRVDPQDSVVTVQSRCSKTLAQGTASSFCVAEVPQAGSLVCSKHECKGTLTCRLLSFLSHAQPRERVWTDTFRSTFRDRLLLQQQTGSQGADVLPRFATPRPSTCSSARHTAPLARIVYQVLLQVSMCPGSMDVPGASHGGQHDDQLATHTVSWRHCRL